MDLEYGAAGNDRAFSRQRRFVKGKKNLKRHLENLECLKEELHEREEKANILNISLELKAQQCKFVHIPQVAAWLHELAAVADRHKFLVLNGPSRLGKHNMQ